MAKWFPAKEEEEEEEKKKEKNEKRRRRQRRRKRSFTVRFVALTGPPSLHIVFAYGF
jgi:hypothetical protein